MQGSLALQPSLKSLLVSANGVSLCGLTISRNVIFTPCTTMLRMQPMKRRSLLWKPNTTSEPYCGLLAGIFRSFTPFNVNSKLPFSATYSTPNYLPSLAWPSFGKSMSTVSPPLWKVNWDRWNLIETLEAWRIVLLKRTVRNSKLP